MEVLVGVSIVGFLSIGVFFPVLIRNAGQAYTLVSFPWLKQPEKGVFTDTISLKEFPPFEASFLSSFGSVV